MEGIWEFEKAEYMERQSQHQGYQVKYTIENEENLYALSACFQEVVSRAEFYGEESAIFTCLFGAYVGNYEFPVNPPHTFGEQAPMIFGNVDTIGKESPFEGLKFNAPQIDYRIEYIDAGHIALILEKSCTETSGLIEGAVRCILKKTN